jgi:hypothetical protein
MLAPDAQQVWRVACLGSKSTVEQRFVNPALPESAVRLGVGLEDARRDGAAAGTWLVRRGRWSATSRVFGLADNAPYRRDTGQRAALWAGHDCPTGYVCTAFWNGYEAPL